jgi:hypothetical protein
MVTCVLLALAGEIAMVAKSSRAITTLVNVLSIGGLLDSR